MSGKGKKRGPIGKQKNESHLYHRSGYLEKGPSSKGIPDSLVTQVDLSGDCHT